MGIARGAYRLLLDAKKKEYLKGESILQLGRQCILFDEATLKKYAPIHGVKLENVQTQLSFNDHHKKLGYIDDFTLFKSLGFKNVSSMDNKDYEGADMIFDLNYPIPEKYHNKFDVIYDGGTAEHVFHFPKLLENLHLLLKEGGVIIHLSPSNNHADHGFYMFSPQIFSYYYSANHYEILTSHYFEYEPIHTQPWTIYNYSPGVIDHLAYGGFGKKMLGIHIVVKKTAQSTCGIIPQQGIYQGNIPQISKMKVDPITRLGISLQKKVKRYAPHFIKASLTKGKKIAKY